MPNSGPGSETVPDLLVTWRADLSCLLGGGGGGGGGVRHTGGDRLQA